jgi:hypothetical protein
MLKQIVVATKYKKKKNWVCEGGLEMVKNNEDGGVVQCWWEKCLSGGLWWPVVVEVMIDGGYAGGLAM